MLGKHRTKQLRLLWKKALPLHCLLLNLSDLRPSQRDRRRSDERQQDRRKHLHQKLCQRLLIRKRISRGSTRCRHLRLWQQAANQWDDSRRSGLGRRAKRLRRAHQAEQYISTWIPALLSQELGYHSADTLVQIGTVVEIGRPEDKATKDATTVTTSGKHSILMNVVASSQLKRI